MAVPGNILGLAADVGGTNLRLALVDDDGGVHAESRCRCAEFSGLAEAVAAWADAQGIDALPPRAAICAAGPVTDGTVRLTNHPWTIDGSELSRRLGISQVCVVNDFTAQALALPGLGPDDLFPVAGGPADPKRPLAVLGPGTGLGVAGLLPGNGPAVERVIDSEAGHMALAARDADDRAVVAALEERYGPVTLETVLSGPGLERLYTVASGGRELAAADVTARAGDGSDPAAGQARDWFLGFLGSAAGDLALAFGARGGVFISGGIVPRLADAIPGSRFHARFVANEKFGGYLAAIPVAVIIRPEPAFAGLARLLRGANSV